MYLLLGLTYLFARCIFIGSLGNQWVSSWLLRSRVTDVNRFLALLNTLVVKILLVLHLWAIWNKNLIGEKHVHMNLLYWLFWILVTLIVYLIRYVLESSNYSGNKWWPTHQVIQQTLINGLTGRRDLERSREALVIWQLRCHDLAKQPSQYLFFFFFSFLLVSDYYFSFSFSFLYFLINGYVREK